MSRAESIDWDGSDALDDRLGQPQELTFPDDWTLSDSWKRAQTERDRGGPAETDAERYVFLEGSDHPHRVVFALSKDRLIADCDCHSFRYRDWCAHVASCWWQWVRGRIDVQHLDFDRAYQTPPAWLTFGYNPQSDALEALTPAELEAYLHCDLGNVGVREHARRTGRSPGTVGNLLRRAREEVGGRS